MMNYSTPLTNLLTTIDYPAHPGDLLREARRDGVPEHEVTLLETLPERAYHGALDVDRSLMRADAQ